MSKVFREFLRKIGSGPHTGENLSRQEAAEATSLILRQEATPAQIGAFMIAHRIKRPTGEELAGMLDAYDQWGPKLDPIQTDRPGLVLGSPYDGRSRTASLSPLTALLLAAADCPVILHGGDTMPTKEGIPLVQDWLQLGVDWRTLSLAQTQQVFAKTGIAFVYLPKHFPLAAGLVPYRDQIGKRPPFATVELIWSPYSGLANIVAGFVHPPTEDLFQEAFRLRDTQLYTTVKGLEGSCDLPRERTAIIGFHAPGAMDLERWHLHPRDYGFAGANGPLETATASNFEAVLRGEPSELWRSILWNGGFYLWRAGVCPDLASGIAKAEVLLHQGLPRQKLQALQAAIV